MWVSRRLSITRIRQLRYNVYCSYNGHGVRDDRMNILLVDDDAFLRDMYATKFNENGDEVTVAENGNEAFSIMHEKTFDVVVMDMVMPGMNGLDLLKSIKAELSDCKSVFVVLSNQGEQTDIDAATEAGASGYIIKAKSIPSEVVTKVHEIVANA